MTKTPAYDAVLRGIEAIRRREPTVRAFSHLAEPAALARAREIDAAPAEALSGLTFGVKDLIDTATMPTTYGSALYPDHRPAADASVVSRIGAAGGCVLGKTVTTEFALMTPGPTTNPHRADHTPGGSSSGSAAAVAAGMIDVGIGTQTYGSVIRPASFCGVFGFKPTHGAVPMTGVRVMAKTFDTIGWMARTPDAIERVLAALSGADVQGRAAQSADLRIGTVHAGAKTGLAEAVRALPGVRAIAPDTVETAVKPVAVEDELELVSHCHGIVAEYEIARSLIEHYEHPGSGLSAPLREFVRRGLAITDSDYAEAAGELEVRTRALLEIFSEVDVILGPCAPGEAPRGLDYTGDPRYCTPWTALGCPALSVPAAVGDTGLPIGVQLVAAPGRDLDAVRAARRLFGALSCSAVRTGG